METLVFERGDRLFIVGPVAPFEATDDEVAGLRYGEDVRKAAPNENLVWMRGQYVEADRANANGALWTADEIAIKSLTPMLMPVTVMHDPRTAVGLIADTQLLVPDKDNVPRSRIDTTLGLWGHRFPDVVEEALANYASGELMQSMECRKGFYECGECGQRFVPLPDDAEKANWCAHLRGETAAANGVPVRRLGAVSFTGTGLIFGTRGARGALDTAHLDVLQEEVAEFHEKAGRDSKYKPKPRSANLMDISDKDYQELVAAKAERDTLKSQVPALEEKASKADDLQKDLEKEQIERKKAEDDLKTEQAARQKLEEQAREGELASERLAKLGDGFKTKLPESVTKRLQEQAKSLADDEWDARLGELEEMAGVKRDEGAPEGENDDTTFTREETARSRAGSGTEPRQGERPSDVARQTTMRGLVSAVTK